MPDQRYDAARQAIGSLLSTTSPKIEGPEWQRSYSWGTQQVETFWSDLVDCNGDGPGNIPHAAIEFDSDEPEQLPEVPTG